MKQLWDVQEKVDGEWHGIYCTPFDNWQDAKSVFDEALLSQKMMNQDNEIRLITVE